VTAEARRTFARFGARPPAEQSREAELLQEIAGRLESIETFLRETRDVRMINSAARDAQARKRPQRH
jgi:hypothetical protein